MQISDVLWSSRVSMAFMCIKRKRSQDLLLLYLKCEAHCESTALGNETAMEVPVCHSPAKADNSMLHSNAYHTKIY